MIKLQINNWETLRRCHLRFYWYMYLLKQYKLCRNAGLEQISCKNISRSITQWTWPSVDLYVHKCIANARVGFHSCIINFKIGFILYLLFILLLIPVCYKEEIVSTNKPAVVSSLSFYLVFYWFDYNKWYTVIRFSDSYVVCLSFA